MKIIGNLLYYRNIKLKSNTLSWNTLCLFRANHSGIAMSSFIKQIKQLLMRYETPIVYSIGLVLSAVIAFRLNSSLKTAAFFDAQCVLKTAKCVMNGISPYHREVWTALHIPAPAHSPALSIIFMPICLFSRVFQNLFFFFVPLFFYYAFVVLVFYYYGFHPKDYLKPRWSNLPVWIVLMLVLISSPLMLMLSAGQISSMAAALLFAALLFPARDKSVNFIFLGLAAALKYSMLTFQVPLLLLQKRFLLAILGFVLFAVLVLSVGFWLNGIIPAFTEYLYMLADDIQHGSSNTYQHGTDPTFIHIGFFTSDILNFLLKIGVIAAYFFALWKIYCRGRKSKSSEPVLRLKCEEWGLFTVMTCIISYHRLHDGVIFMPFLGVLFLEQCNQAFSCSCRSSALSKVKAAFLLFFLLFWACPRKIIFRIAGIIATSFPTGTEFFRYGSEKQDGGMLLVTFPLLQCIIILMLVFLSWLVFSNHQTDAGQKES